MGLKDVYVPTKTVTVMKGVDVTVRGLTATDLVYFEREYPEALIAIFEGANFGDSAELCDRILTYSPNVAALIVSFASEEPENLHEFLKINVQKQIELIQAVFELTIPDPGDEASKKMMARVYQLLKNFGPMKGRSEHKKG